MCCLKVLLLYQDRAEDVLHPCTYMIPMLQIPSTPAEQQKSPAQKTASTLKMADIYHKC